MYSKYRRLPLPPLAVSVLVIAIGSQTCCTSKAQGRSKRLVSVILHGWEGQVCLILHRNVKVQMNKRCYANTHSISNFVLLLLLEHYELTAVVTAGLVSCSDCLEYTAGLVSCSDCLEYFAEVCSHHSSRQ